MNQYAIMANPPAVKGSIFSAGQDIEKFEIDLTPPKVNVKEKFLAAGGGRIGRLEVRKRAAEAMQRNLPTFMQCPNVSKEWAIIGGGPSINQCVDQIRALKRRGVNIVSVNKSHDWLLENDIKPWGHVLLDAKEWVADYVKRPRKDVRYFVSSQCHAKTFEALKGHPVFLWHCGQDFDEGPEPLGLLKEKWPRATWYVVPGPTTVGLRSIHLGHAMGVDKFHLFGLDSSRIPKGKMHAYDKPEPPDAETGTLALKYKGQKYAFETNAHMVRQQMDFDQLLEELPHHFETGCLRKTFEVTVYGSGMLPFFAAMVGLHADPMCNLYPSRVGGYLIEDPSRQKWKQDMAAVSAEVEAKKAEMRAGVRAHLAAQTLFPTEYATGA